MTEWNQVKFNASAAFHELQELEEFLRQDRSIPESNLKQFFDARPQLIASCGLFSGADRIDRWAPQVDLGGRHKCDYAAGHHKSTAYTLVEIEDASESSIFGSAPATPYFTDRFNHGFSQVVDWLCQLDSEQPTPTFQTYWGPSPSPHFVGLLLIGRRRESHNHDDSRWLLWRNAKVRVNSHAVQCLTYDDFVDRLHAKLDLFSDRT